VPERKKAVKEEKTAFEKRGVASELHSNLSRRPKKTNGIENGKVRKVQGLRVYAGEGEERSTLTTLWVKREERIDKEIDGKKRD